MYKNDKFRESVTQSTSLPTQAEQVIALARINRFYSLFFKTTESKDSLPSLVKKLSLQPCSSRFISSLFYKKSHNEHGDQYSGREIKRWAAIQLGELFTDEAEIKEHRFSNFVGEFWHE